MTIKRWLFFALAAGSLALLTGCDRIGMTSSGGSDAEVKAAFNKMPLDEQVKSIMSSPAPQAQKEQMVRDAYAKAGKEVPADLFKSTPETSH